MAVAYNFAGPRIVDDGLILYLDAGNPNSYNPSTPLIWRDISRNGNNFVFSSVPNIANGVFNNQGTIYAYRSAIPVNSATNGYSFELAIKINSSLSSTWQNIIQNGLGDPNRHMVWYNGGSNTFQALFHPPNNYNNISNVLSFNTWYYLALAYNPSGGGSNGRRLWLNGLEQTVNNTAAGNANASANYFTVGINQDLSTLRSNTTYSFIRYYNRALSPAEITQNFNATRGRFGI